MDNETPSPVGRKRRPYCPFHTDPSQWTKEPVPGRYGWEEARCRHCGTFIGQNPVRVVSAPVLESAVKADEQATFWLKDELYD